jgi:hypothetical protein
MRSFLYLSLILLYIVSNFFSASLLAYLTGLFAILVLAVSFSHANGLYFYSGIAFLIAGAGLYFYNIDYQGLLWHEFLLHFEAMLGILSLFMVLPFINSLIRVGKYDKNLSLLLQQRITSLSSLYRRSFIVCHFLGLLLNIATIPLLSNSLHNTLKQIPKKSAERFYSQNLLRAYALCLTWNPLEVMVVIALDMTNSNYFSLFPVIISIVILFILLDWFLFHRKYSHINIKIDQLYPRNNKRSYRKILEMLILLGALVLIVSLFQGFLNKGFLFSLVLVLIPFSLLWSVFVGKSRSYRKVTIPYWKERTNGLSNLFFMFLSAGFFVEMITLSNSLSFLQKFFINSTDHTLIFYLAIGFYFLIASLVGFHPLVSLTLLAALLTPVLPDVSSISLAVVLITCSLASVMYSPYNLSVSILADKLRLNPYKMGGRNLLFAIAFMAFSILIAYQLSFIQ